MIGWLILAAVLALCAVLCIRAARFKPEAGAGAAPTPVAVDTEGAVQRLAQLVRIPTVSNYDAEKFDETQFEGFREKLRELYPRVHEMCPPVRIAHTGMLFHWKGKSSAAPVVLMAHYDVVPVDEAGWKHPPFCGEVFDGELWGARYAGHENHAAGHSGGGRTADERGLCAPERRVLFFLRRRGSERAERTGHRGIFEGAGRQARNGGG